MLSINRRNRMPAPSFSIVLLLLLPTAHLYGQAQAYNASLSGIVTDSSESAVPDATVKLPDPERGFNREFHTSGDGRYVFTLLPPGTYTLRVELTGFRPLVQEGVILSVGQAATLNLKLEIGSVNEQVVVTAAAPLLNTDNANVASTVTEHETVELPLNLRNVYGLVSLNSAVNNSIQFQNVNSPGTQGTADQDISFFNFGGAYMGTTSFLLDGTWDIAADWGGTLYVPSVDNVQEFKIQSNAFTAQYGWASGNVVNVITKSGTSSFHGDVFEFLRNSALDANNFFNNAANVPKPAFRRNQFGVTAGGPLYIPKLYQQTDKTFFFVDYEGLRQSTPLTLVTTMPTSAMRNGDFSNQLGDQIGTDCLGRPVRQGQIYNPFTTRAITAGQMDVASGAVATCGGYIRDAFAGNIIPPNMIDSVAKKLLPYWPNSTGPGVVNNYTASGAAPVYSNEYSIRADHNISDKSLLFFRWSQKFEYKGLAGNLYGDSDPGGPGVIAPNNRWNATANYSHVFNPTTVMSVNLGVSRWTEGNAVQGYPFKPSSLGLPAFIDVNSNQFPNISISGMASLGPSQSAGAGQGTFPRNDGTYSLDITKTHSSHTMNFGFMGVLAQTLGGRIAPTSFNFPVAMTQGPDPTRGTPATGFGFASFLLGTGDNSGSTGVAALPAASKNQLGWYFQDDWKMRRNLTVNLGLRYELQTAPTERFDRQSWFDFTATNPISQQVGFKVPGQLVFTGGSNRRGLFDPQLNNIAPRIGIAYQWRTKFVVRTGFGIFYLPAYRGSGTLAGFSQTTPYVGTLDGITPQNVLSNPFPGGLIAPPGKSLGGLTNVGLSTSAVENQRPTSYMEQWMFGLQYAVTPNNLIDATYVGNHGVKLAYGTVQEDQLPPQALPLGNALLQSVPNPFYGAIATSACGLDHPTVPYGQLLRPYPEFCGVSNSQVIGAFSHYNAMEISFTHRWSDGLQLLFSYTVSKFIDNSSGPAGFVSSAGTFRNFYDLSAEKSLNADDIPQSLVISYVYELPFGRGKRIAHDLPGPINALLGGWQLSGITTAKAGFPLSISAATNNTNSLGGNQRPNLIGDPHLANPTLAQWFNTAAFAQPAPFTFGNVPRTMPNLRAPGFQNWDIAIQKWWKWHDKIRAQLRSEMYNAFNHSDFYAPNTTFGDPRFGTISGAIPSRDIQFGLKMYW